MKGKYLGASTPERGLWRAVAIGAGAGLLLVAGWLVVRKGVQILREKTFVKVVTNYGALIRKYAAAYGVDPHLVAAVIVRESKGNPTAGSSAGARGLMQLMPGTAAEMGVTNILDPEQNIMGGTKYLAKQLATFKDVKLALAAYNAGPGRVEDCLKGRAVCVNNIPKIYETQQYVVLVLDAYATTSKDIWGSVA